MLIEKLMTMKIKKKRDIPHGVPDPPSLAQMTLTQCTSMSELIFDSGAHPGGQIQQYLSFSALFGSPTKYMAKSTGLP